MPKRKEVDDWLTKSGHPQLAAMRALRAAILAADRRMDECIKWSSPTFTYQGNFASMNPRSKAHLSLMVHRGAAIPGKHPRLAGSGGTVRTMRFADAAEVKQARPAIARVVKAWCKLRDTELAAKSRK